jgi:hypothetical protein
MTPDLENCRFLVETLHFHKFQLSNTRLTHCTNTSRKKNSNSNIICSTFWAFAGSMSIGVANPTRVFLTTNRSWTNPCNIERLTTLED